MSEYNINGLAVPLFLLIMLVEYLFLRLQGRSLHRYNDSVTSLSMGLCLLISDALLKAYTFAVFIYLWEQHRFFDFSASAPLTWLVFFFGVDFCYYWFHRLAHEVNFLWGAHVGHHQSEEYNLTTALRQSAFQYAFSWVFYLPLALLGCPPKVFLVQFILLKLYQFWLHTQAIHRIPGLEGFFSTPSSHRVHHAKNPRYIDKNYGGTLVIWDRLFGTWQPELASEACHYGTTQPLNTLNPVKANLQHWALLGRDTLHTKHWQDKFKLWWKPTGWRPADCYAQETPDSPAVAMQKFGCSERQKYDPQCTRGVKLYVALSMLSLFIVSSMFVFLAPQLDGKMLLAGSLLIISGLVVANALLENQRRYSWLELIRLPLFLVFAVTLWHSTSSTTVVNRIAIHHAPQAVLDYASSAARWPEWHPQSLTVYLDDQVPVTQGEGFEEDILTPIGVHRLVWEVDEAVQGQRWIASAVNQNNNALIRLQYTVSPTANGTLFERTLDYQLPNALLVAFNALYLQAEVEQKSQSALLKLKARLESGALN